MNARYYNGEPDEPWPSVGGGGFTYAEYQRLKAAVCPDCGETPCAKTCGCKACRAAEALVPVGIGSGEK